MLEGILEAGHHMDYVLLADLLELQLSTLLCNVQELIMKKEDLSFILHCLFPPQFLAKPNHLSKCFCAAIRKTDIILRFKRRLFIPFQCSLFLLLLFQRLTFQMVYVNPKDCNMAYNYTKELRPKLFKRLREFRWIDPIHETAARKKSSCSPEI